MAGLELVEFVDNPEPRCPCVLLLDTSASMAGPPIDQLNEGLRTLKEELASDPLARLRGEIMVVTFGDGGVVAHGGFCTVDDWTPPVLGAGGSTPLGAALSLGSELTESRKDSYRAAGINYYRPWLIVITDGAPTDDWESAASRVKRLDESKAVVALPVGTMEADFEVLSAISTKAPKRLDSVKFREFFVWLSQSAQQVSASAPGDQVALPPTTGWEVID